VTDKAGATLTVDNDISIGAKIAVDGANITLAALADAANDTAVNGLTFAEVRSDDNAFVGGQKYVIQTLGSTNSTGTIDSGGLLKYDADYIAAAATAEDGTALTGTLSVGQTILIKEVGTGAGQVKQEVLDGLNALTEGMTFTRPTETLTVDIEAIQAKINTARVQAGSQYAALESAVEYTTDLTAQYELGFNTVNDVNFSAETAHLAKNQILQQAATAMLAQANSGQQGLLQLIQG
jgi:flagellin